MQSQRMQSNPAEPVSGPAIGSGPGPKPPVDMVATDRATPPECPGASVGPRAGAPADVDEIRRDGPTVRIRGLRKTVDLIVRRVAMEAGDAGYGIDPLHRSIATERRALESELRQRGVPAGRLTDEARGVRGWLGWLVGGSLSRDFDASAPEATPVAPAAAPIDDLDAMIDGSESGDEPHPLVATVAATRRLAQAINRRLDASDELIRHLTGRRTGGRPILVSDPEQRVSISFRPMRAVTRAEVRDGAVRVWVQAPLAMIGDEGLDALAGMVAGDAGTRRAVHDAMLAGPFQSALASIEAFGGTVERSAGRVHDLGASFDRVNEAYFGGHMERPTISWSRSETRRMFGHYEFVADALVVSSSLDREDVPEFVVDFIVYHELLHKKHGLRWSGTRAHAHTAAFRTDERKFTAMVRAERVLRRIAAGR